MRVSAAGLDADANPPVIIFNVFLENDLREDSGTEHLPMHSLVVVQSLLVDGVVRNISVMKVVVEEFAHWLQELHTRCHL